MRCSNTTWLKNDWTVTNMSSKHIYHQKLTKNWSIQRGLLWSFLQAFQH